MPRAPTSWSRPRPTRGRPAWPVAPTAPTRRWKPRSPRWPRHPPIPRRGRRRCARWRPPSPPRRRSNGRRGWQGLTLEAFAAAQECGSLADRAAYAEAQALARRALGLVRDLPGPAVREMAGDLDRLAALLPVVPPATLPAMGAVSALVSRAVLAASDAGR